MHKAKPTVCAMFPIGRCLAAKNPEEGLKDISEEQVQYIFMDPECGDKSETHTPREYLESFGIPVPDDFFLRWQNVVLRMGDTFRQLETKVKPEVMQQVWTVAFIGLYLHYEMEEEFMVQFEKNAEAFFKMVESAIAEGGDNSKIK